MSPRLRRLPFLAPAMIALVAGVWGGLLRLEWRLPVAGSTWNPLHGPLMVSGFLGTLIGVERAIGLGRRWAWAAPLMTGAGGLLLVLGVRGGAGPALIAAGSLTLVIVFAAIYAAHPDRAVAIMGLAATTWLVGNVLWLWSWISPASTLKWQIPDVVPWWAAFLILTIAGERLELTRFVRPPPYAQGAFLFIAGLIGLGALLSTVRPNGGAREAGAGMLALALWLFRWDIARRTIRQSGLSRFIAVALLSGYVWLAVSGVLALIVGAPGLGPAYDAILHALFVGFVVSMIFGHAPIIVPAVLGVAIEFSPRFYTHLALLHFSLCARLAGDLAGLPRLRMWGGLLNAVAIALFMVNTALSVRAQPGPSRAGGG